MDSNTLPSGADSAPITASTPPSPGALAQSGQSAAGAIARIVQGVCRHSAQRERMIPDLPGISPQQELALSALAGGKGLLEAAEEAGISRTTLYRWRMHDLNFVAALNRVRRETCQIAIESIAQVTARAAQLVVKAIENGDLRAAVTILKESGVFKEAIRPRPDNAAGVGEIRERDESGRYLYGEQAKTK